MVFVIYVDQLIQSRKSFKSKQIKQVDDDQKSTLSRTNTNVDEDGFTVREEPNSPTTEPPEQISEEIDSPLSIENEKQIKLKIKEKSTPVDNDFSGVFIEPKVNTIRRRGPTNTITSSPLQQEVMHRPTVPFDVEPTFTLNEKINALFTPTGLSKCVVAGEVLNTAILKEGYQLITSDFLSNSLVPNTTCLVKESNTKYTVSKSIVPNTILLKYNIDVEDRDSSYCPLLIEAMWKFENGIKCIITLVKNKLLRKQVILSNLSLLFNANQPISTFKCSIPSVLMNNSILKMELPVIEEDFRILLQLDCTEKKEIAIALQFQLDTAISDFSLIDPTLKVIKASINKYIYKNEVQN